MFSSRLQRVLLAAVLAAGGALCAVLPPLASSSPASAAEETFTDPADDNPGGVAPDITKITVGMSTDGVIAIRIDTPNRTSIFQTDAVVMYMNTDLNASTGSAGSDYRIEAFGGSGAGVQLSRWSGSSWDRAVAPSFTGSFSGGITASVRREDIGVTSGFA